ncbi:hypothetical protein L9F63_003064, partial [Diploptera punctata]
LGIQHKFENIQRKNCEALSVATRDCHVVCSCINTTAVPSVNNYTYIYSLNG